jgi:hypothetical protein
MNRQCTCPDPCKPCAEYAIAHNQKLQAASLKKRLPDNQSPYKIYADKIKEWYEQGVTQVEIAERIGGTDKGVLAHLKRHGLWRQQNKGPGQGWKPPLEVIKAYQAKKLSLRLLAKQAGIPQTTLVSGLRRAGVYRSIRNHNR